MERDVNDPTPQHVAGTGPDPWALRKEANGHRKARRYAEAVRTYAALWRIEDARDAWDGWGYAFCLDKVGETRQALDVCREAYRLDPEHRPTRQLYARCIYLLELKGAEGDPTRMQRAADGVCKLVSQDDEYAPYVVPAVLAVANELKRRGRYADVLAWLDRLDASRLSVEPFEFAREGRTSKGPSDAQRYWGLRCKALFETGAHAACREAVAEAMLAVPHPVNDGDVWLHRLAALSSAAEGEAAAAYEELSKLLGKKPVWFLEYDLAGLARDLGREDDAWRHLLRVLLDRAPFGLRVGAFERASEWLEADGDAAAAAEHLSVALAIRTSEGWPVRGALQQRAQALGASPSPSLRDAIRALVPVWKERLDALEPRLRGTILQVIADGRAGFIQADDGESYYFRASDLHGASVEAGLAVTFRTAPGFDRKKNRATVNAVDIRPLR